MKYGWERMITRNRIREMVVSCLNTFDVCLGLDRQVFKMQDALPLSHPNCLCYYTPYITKDAKYEQWKHLNNKLIVYFVVSFIQTYTVFFEEDEKVNKCSYTY